MDLRRWIGAMLRHRAWVLGAIAVVTVSAGAAAFRLEFDHSIEIWFLDDDPDLVSYREFLDRFAADEIAVIGVFADDVFVPDVLAAIRRMTEAVEEAPWVHRVDSVANVRVASTVDGALEFVDLFEDVPSTAVEALAVRERALASPILRNTLVSSDGRGAAIVVEMLAEANTFVNKVEFSTALEEIAARERRPGTEILLAGSPIFDRAFYERSVEDNERMTPLMIAVIVIIAFAVFRRFSSAIVPLAVVGVAVTWLFGIMAVLGFKMNTATVVLVAVVMAVGVADTIHVLADYYQQLMKGEAPDVAVEHSISQLFLPCFFTSATTIAGFLSLLVSGLRPIREVGVLAAIGVACAFVVSFTLVPVILRFAKPPAAAFIERQRRGPLQRLLERLGRPGLGTSRVVLAGSVPLVLGSIGLTATIPVGSNPVNYFLESDPVRQSMEEVDRRMGGSITVEFLVDAEDGGWKDPERLRRIDRFERWLERRPGITTALSAADGLKEMNRIFHDGEVGSFRVPDSRPLAAQYYLLMEGEDDFDSMIQSDYEIGRITARVRMTEASAITGSFEAIQDQIERELSSDGLKTESTGFIKLMYKMEEYLVSSQIESLLVAFAVITVMMGLLLRSIRLALFSMIPNLVPLALGLGFMGIVGIPLDPGTVMIGSIAIGLVVDDSVHFLVRLRRQVDEGKTLEESVQGTMLETGRPIIVTSIVLAAGFATNALGSFAPNIYFGLVSALVILLALVADLVMLPAALLVIRPRLTETSPSSAKVRS